MRGVSWLTSIKSYRTGSMFFVLGGGNVVQRLHRRRMRMSMASGIPLPVRAFGTETSVSPLPTGREVGGDHDTTVIATVSHASVGRSHHSVPCTGGIVDGGSPP